MKLWAGQTISELGSRITRDGLPLAAVLTLGATPAQMGLLAAIGSAPVLLLGLVAGVWVDRLRRRPIMIVADLGRAALLITIPAAALLGVLNIWQLYIVAALTGILTLFFDVAYQSYLPSLVERENIVEGNSKLALSGSVAEFAGPTLTGFLVQTLTAPIAILFDALSFLVSVVSVALVRKPEPAPVPTQGRQNIGREAVEGLRVVLDNPVLRAFAGRSGTASFFGNFLAGLYGLYAIRVLGLGPAALGVIIAMGGAGDFLGALLAGRVVQRIGLGPTLVGASVLTGFIGFLLPLAGGPPIMAAAFLVAGQLFGDMSRTIYDINSVSLRQVITPDRLLGRTNASMQLLEAGVGPMGAMVGGILAEVMGVRQAVFISALGSLCASLWLIFSPVRELHAQPSPAE
jgi:MFS family permease